MKYKINTLSLISLLTALLISGNAMSALEDITVMALAPLEGNVVIKTENGKMFVLAVGDVIPGSQATLKQVLTDKFVADDLIAGEPPVSRIDGVRVT